MTDVEPSTVPDGCAEAELDAADQPSFRRRLALLGLHGSLIAVLLAQFGKWSWLGAMLLTITPLLALVLLAYLVWLRRSPLYAALIQLALLGALWPWLLAAYAPPAETIGPDVPSLRVCVLDCTGWSGDRSEAFAERLIALEADCWLLLVPMDERGLADALRGDARVRESELRLVREPRDWQGSWSPMAVLILSRVPLADSRLHVLPGNPGLLIDCRVPVGADELRLLAVQTPGQGDPRHLGHDQALVDRLVAELREDDEPVLCALPRAWPTVHPHWRRLGRAGLRRPAPPRAGVWPAWVPSWAGIQLAGFAVRGLAASRCASVYVHGVPRRALLCEVGSAP